MSTRGGIGLLGASAIGVGGMVGGGIFAVLGLAVQLAGGGTPLAFVLAGAVALLTSYSYARLSGKHYRREIRRRGAGEAVYRRFRKTADRV